MLSLLNHLHRRGDYFLEGSGQAIHRKNEISGKEKQNVILALIAATSFFVSKTKKIQQKAGRKVRRKTKFSAPEKI